MSYTVEVEGLRKVYGVEVALDSFDLRVEAGTVLALLGPNGAGKSTVVDILSTLLTPDAGVATIAGHDLRKDPVGVRRSISVTGQQVALDDVLTTDENLMMMARLRRLGPRGSRERVDSLIDEFDLEEVRHRRVAACSGGIRRRIDVAASLVHDPTVVFLDEPTTGLDPRSRRQMWESVRRMVQRGTTVMLTTQYLDEADRLADRIVMLDRGRIVAEGTADELKASVSGEVALLEFIDVHSCRQAAASLDAPWTIGADRWCSFEVTTDGSAESVRELLSRLAGEGTPVGRLTLQRPSLDDVFFALTSTASSCTVSSS